MGKLRLLGVTTVFFAAGYVLVQLVTRYYDTRSLDEVQRVYIRKPLSRPTATDRSVGVAQIETAAGNTSDKRDDRSRKAVDTDDAYHIEIE